MSPTKNPDFGTKVTPGQDAPVTQENAGTVLPESLAAESNTKEGGFSSNQGIHGENVTTASSDSSTTRAPGSKGHVDSSSKTQGGAAPSYVNSQLSQDPNGPHGKNLKEGDWDESKGKDGLQKALNSEPGSKNDPSRLAEHQFQLKDSVGGPGAGARQAELTKKTAFDALDSETPS
ncbi:hypothetical protein B0J13DRAFT_608307 [Dactylonectria estremocensis]|uniref:Uncharacterized protein n=1 Tax=Dactylonectria estremocensis TaxID=1079267 RepID=A0A9P9EQE2_9HYPO|nr:hypothetical protein B0J13DRAFT_608307 [Dactylonectria estremocensis]